jgi:hypothetical protein
MAAQDSDEYLIAQVDLLAFAIEDFQKKFDEQLQALALQTSVIAKAVQDHRKRHKPTGGFTDALRSSSSASSHHDGSMNSGPESSQTNRWLANGQNASSRKSTPDRAQKLGMACPELVHHHHHHHLHQNSVQWLSKCHPHRVSLCSLLRLHLCKGSLMVELRRLGCRLANAFATQVRFASIFLLPLTKSFSTHR